MTIIDQIEALDQPNYRKKQIIQAIFKENILDFSKITTLPLSLRSDLQEQIPLTTLKILKVLVSAQKDTVKWSFITKSGNPIETVLMVHGNGRRTICVSCQSGCPVNCSFCWTGAMGFRQNLSSWEILEQIIVVNDWIKNNAAEVGLDPLSKNLNVNRVVFMGMGEPMINLLEVTDAVKVLINKEVFGMSQRSITVSTSGYIPMMKRFWKEFPKIGLAISLHAPTQELREKLMPVARQFNLDELIAVCKDIQYQTGRRATYEYILIDNVTDTEESAVQLAKLLKGQLAHVNLIPYNPIAGRDEFKRPSRNRVMHFCNILRELGISATPRVTMGDDIKAACGQLSDEESAEELLD